MTQNSHRYQIEWLTLLLAAITLTALTTAYLLIDNLATPDASWTRLTLDVLPNLIAALIVTLGIYWALKKKAIPSLTESLKQNSTNVNQKMSTLENKGLKDFFEKFGETPWSQLIQTSGTIDIVTWYFDSWIRNHRTELRDFFNRGGRVQLILPDPRDSFIISLTQERYPDLDPDDARKKITNTGIRLYELAAESGSKLARVDVILSNRVLSYSSIRFDNNAVILSVFDQFRSGQVDSPAILIDLGKSESLRKYWDKEIGGFFDIGQHIDLDTLRSIYSRPTTN